MTKSERADGEILTQSTAWKAPEYWIYFELFNLKRWANDPTCRRRRFVLFSMRRLYHDWGHLSMVLPLYLAMTRAEFTACSSLPVPMAWMACHFSPYGTGLTNLPPALPRASMVILNDRIPPAGHDPEYILSQLRALNCACLLLDFQLPGSKITQALAAEILTQAGCPVGVSEAYAQALDCPVFLPPVPTDVSPKDYLAPWSGREIWLEAALEGQTITLTSEGSSTRPLPRRDAPVCLFGDDDLFCHYGIRVSPDQAEISLTRTRDDLERLLQEGARLGVTRAIGLYQELNRQESSDS